MQYSSIRQKSVLNFLFHYGPLSIPIPECREIIEYTIIKDRFKKDQNLPNEFKFSNYMCQVLQKYVISLVEVRPINWIILSLLVGLNYIKISEVDRYIEGPICEMYPSASIEDDVAKSEHCEEYMIRYSFVYLSLLFGYMLVLFVVSEMYLRKLLGIIINKAMLPDSIEYEFEELQANTNTTKHSELPRFDTSSIHFKQMINQSVEKEVEVEKAADGVISL